MRVIIDRRILASFRRRALAKYPVEYMEMVWGLSLPNRIEINAFAELEHSATPLQIDYDMAELHNGAKEAEEVHLECLGSIHSHPQCESAEPSEADWIDGCKGKESIMGILAIWKSKSGRFRSRLKWWRPEMPLKIEVR